MRRFSFVILFVISVLAVSGQVVRWVMPPVYDSIYIAEGAPLIIGDSLGTTSINTLEGVHVDATSDLMHPFVEQLSVVTDHDTENVVGFYDDEGRFVPLSGYTVVYDYPYFSDGRLLAKRGDFYCSLNAQGEESVYSHFAQVYPFNCGVAACLAYESAEKLKNPHYLHVTADHKIVSFTYKGKEVDRLDVQFLSSLNDEGIGVAVYKNKIYLVSTENTVLTPAFATLAETNVKKQLAVVGEKEQLLKESKGTYVLRGKSGKNDFVEFYFDELMQLKRVNYADGTEKVYTKQVQEPLKYRSPLQALQKGYRWGIVSKGRVVLPPQFEDYGFAVGNYAAVCLDGKWGLLVYDEHLPYRLLLNDGNDVGFRHKNRVVPVRLELPSVISADKCRFDLDPQHGCSVDKLSLETKNTEYGNYVQYKCKLAIPDSLPDMTVDVSYPVQITYDRLIYPIDSIKIKAWHVKYINVDLDESETFVEDGKVSFTVNMTMVKEVGEADYPFSVEVLGDSLPSEVVKLSETRYVCNLDSVREGVNYVHICVREEGCPPSIYPFEITYTTPLDANGEAKKDAAPEVTIKKKVYMEQPKHEDTSSLAPIATDTTTVIL